MARRRNPTAAKIAAEAQAGRVQADVFDAISSMVPLRRAGLVAPFVPSAAGQYPADLKDADGYWIAILLYVLRPASTPRWCPRHRRPKPTRTCSTRAGKETMAWNPGSMAGAIGFVGNTLIGMGEERGRAYLEALSRQQIVNIEASSRAILDQVIAGEYRWAS